MKVTIYVRSYEELYNHLNENLKRLPRQRGEPFRDYMIRKLDYVYETVVRELRNLYTALESIDTSGEFYKELFKAYVGILPEELARRVRRYMVTVKNVHWDARSAFRGIGEKDGVKASELFKRSAGRMLSFYKRLSREVNLVKQYFKELSKMPDVRGDYVVVLAGVPQVGKSTLLSKLTRAKPEIGAYPFTTKTLVAGHIEVGELGKIVLVDSPGILDSPLDEKNLIELKAVLAVRHLADHVLYVFATYPHFYYTLDEQLSVYRSVMKLLEGKPCTPILNKVDLMGQDLLNDVVRRIESEVGVAPLPVSALNELNLDFLRKTIIDAFMEKVLRRRQL